MSSAGKAKLKEAAAGASASLLSNPVVQWTLAIAVPALLIYFFLPSFFSGVKKGAAAATDAAKSVLQTQKDVAAAILAANPFDIATDAAAAAATSALGGEQSRTLSDAVDYLQSTGQRAKDYIQSFFN